MNSSIQNKTAFTIPLLGGIPVAESVLVTWILMAIIMAAVWLLARKLKPDHPGRGQSLLEMGVGFINSFTKDNIGPHWRSFAPWLGTVAVYITIANLSGAVGFTPPTKDISVTAALALTSVFLIYGGMELESEYTAQSPNLPRARSLGRFLLEEFYAGRLDEIRVIFTEMVTPMARVRIFRISRQ